MTCLTQVIYNRGLAFTYSNYTNLEQLRLFKLRIVRNVDESGRRVGKTVSNVRRKLERSRKWYGKYKDERGIVRRVLLAADKAAAQSMLNELVKKVERRQTGLVDPFEEHAKRRLVSHIDDYEAFLNAKGNSVQHVSQTMRRIRKLVDACEFVRLSDIKATRSATWLADQRATKKWFSAQTSNFYLDGFKYFCNWLVTHERLARNTVASLQRVNIDVDRQHDWRSLTPEEFSRLIHAAESGRMIEGISGPDRAMLSVLSSWTGFRRNELASITQDSLTLDGETPTVRVKAAFSKRRMNDVLPLYPYVLERLRAHPDLLSGDPLFALKTAKGHFRKTSKMMKHDLGEACEAWLAEASSSDELSRREASEFWIYRDENGLFADFHANRRTFISNLGRAGVPLTIAQKLARHSDPRLTANRYTHLELDDQVKAIASLESPKASVTVSEAAQTTSEAGQFFGCTKSCLLRSPPVVRWSRDS